MTCGLTVVARLDEGCEQPYARRKVGVSARLDQLNCDLEVALLRRHQQCAASALALRIDGRMCVDELCDDRLVAATRRQHESRDAVRTGGVELVYRLCEQSLRLFTGGLLAVGVARGAHQHGACARIGGDILVRRLWLEEAAHLHIGAIAPDEHL